MPPAVTTTISFLLMKPGGDECFVAPCISYASLNAEDVGSPVAFDIDRNFIDPDIHLVDQKDQRVDGKPVKRRTSSEDGR